LQVNFYFHGIYPLTTTMEISATAALVLNWTSSNVWQSPLAQAYLQGLDLSEGQSLLSRFNQQEHYMHLQAVSNRKYFVRQKAIAFIDDCNRQQVQPQIIILAAGIAPLSIELAAYAPHAAIFDVDKYLMDAKLDYFGAKVPQVRFITADVTDMDALQQQLSTAGWNAQAATLIVMEGIVYYIPTAALKSILEFFASSKASLVADYALEPTSVHIDNRIYVKAVFEKISDAVGLSDIYFYTPNTFNDIVQQRGYNIKSDNSLADIQQEFRGQVAPFEQPDSGWIRLVYASPSV
jgi:O-methyltransferase involved in polyketide biosynthesis